MGAGAFGNTPSFLSKCDCKAGRQAFSSLSQTPSFIKSVISTFHQTNSGSEMLNCLSGSVSGGNSNSDASTMILECQHSPRTLVVLNLFVNIIFFDMYCITLVLPCLELGEQIHLHFCTASIIDETITINLHFRLSTRKSPFNHYRTNHDYPTFEHCT